jgi:ribosomal protein S18 acetylase RimI-like enzyme
MGSQTAIGPLTIARATAPEREWAAALMASSEPWTRLGRGLESCRASCHNPDFLLFIAHADDEPAGFILLQRRGVAGSPYVASIAVAERFRGGGIGSLLLGFAEDFFRADARHIFLCVSSFNGRARSLYEQLGYVAVGELEDYVISGASEILMHKRLLPR